VFGLIQKYCTTTTMEKIIKKLIAFFINSRVFAFPRRLAEAVMNHALSIKNGVAVYYPEEERAKVMVLVRKIKRETDFLIFDNEAQQIYMAVRATKKIKGDIAELGSYTGGSAKLISEAKGERTLHLFDTFEGLPPPSKKDTPDQFYESQFQSSLENLKNYLKNYPNIHIYPGFFPNTAESIKDEKFSFVNLDADLYEGTLSGLKFFYPRVNRGGIIICHDYSHAQGVKQAVSEFFNDKPEVVLELSGTQCLIVKI